MVHRIQCAEIWGGIRGDHLEASSSGIRASLFSRACDGGKGGDVYYLSVCDNDLLTRMALIDVVGHGERVSHAGQWAYESLQAHMNDGNGAQVLTDLNLAAAKYGYDAMATAVVAAYYRANETLLFSYAGHHPLLLNRKDESEWTAIHSREQEGLSGLPLGFDEDTQYAQGEIRLSPGDRIFMFTDGVTEARNRSYQLFGERRLLDLMRSTHGSSLSETRDAVLAALHDFTDSNLAHDDVTFMAVEVLA